MQIKAFRRLPAELFYPIYANMAFFKQIAMNRFVFIYRTTKVRLKSRDASYRLTPPLCFL